MLWLLGTLVVVLIVNLLIFGIEGLKDSSQLDINVHDTYFVFANIHLVLLLSVSALFLIYLLRTIARNFKNIAANLVLMISTLLLITALLGVSSIVESLMEETTSWTVYPPLETGIDQTETEYVDTNLHLLSRVLFYTQIALFLFFLFCGYKTRRNYKRSLN